MLVKSNILNCDEIVKCKYAYKNALVTGDFTNANEKMCLSINTLLNNYTFEDLECILKEEIQDQKMKNNYFNNFFLVILLTMVIQVCLDHILPWLFNKDIPKEYSLIMILGAIIYGLVVIIIDLIKKDNTNFLKYYLEKITIYKKTNEEQNKQLFDI